jgi:hypothetical protein
MSRMLRYYRIKTVKYLNRVGVAFSIFVNVVAGGSSNQTFSARNYNWRIQGRLNIVWLIDKFFWFDKNHCLMAWVYWKTSKDLRKKQFYKEISEDYIRKDSLYYYHQE